MGKRGPKPGDVGYRPPRDPLERVMERVVKQADGCWLWTGPRMAKGYGITKVGSRLDGTYAQLVHRIVYERMVGPIPVGLQIDHLCTIKHCVNPEHLDPVTNAENARRRGERMTHCRRGHPRTPEHSRRVKSGAIQCITCEREQAKARRARIAQGRN